jgi:Rieske Fe-S protein
MKPPNWNSTTVPPDGTAEELQPKWRQDFPINIPQDGYISRREFTKFLVLISFSFVVGQIWILMRRMWRRSTGGSSVVEIASIHEMNMVNTRLFHYPGRHDPCILVRVSEQNYVAYSQKCTHLSCPILPDLNKKHFRCPCHEGYFEMETGVPFAGPPRRPLTRINLEIRNSRIFATGMEGEA